MVQVKDNRVVFGKYMIPIERISEFVAFTVRQGAAFGHDLMQHQPDSREFMATWNDTVENHPASIEALQFQFVKEATLRRTNNWRKRSPKG